MGRNWAGARSMGQAQQQALATICQLCRQKPAIENSHVTSALVYRAIKSDSPTGFFRNPNNPNKRVQDGDKLPILCMDCERRFGIAESEFGKNIFSAFHKSDCDEFSYGPWLHYFMTSLAWRTLVLDLPGLESEVANPQPVIAEMTTAAETMRQYLLGANNLADCLRNHAGVYSDTVFWIGSTVTRQYCTTSQVSCAF